MDILIASGAVLWRQFVTDAVQALNLLGWLMSSSPLAFGLMLAAAASAI